MNLPLIPSRGQARDRLRPNPGRPGTAATRPAGLAWSARSAGPWSARVTAPGAPSPRTLPVHCGPVRDHSASQAASLRPSRERRARNPVTTTTVAARAAAARAANACSTVTSARCTGGSFQPARPVGPHHDGRAGPGAAGRVDLALARRPARRRPPRPHQRLQGRLGQRVGGLRRVLQQDGRHLAPACLGSLGAHAAGSHLPGGGQGSQRNHGKEHHEQARRDGRLNPVGGAPQRVAVRPQAAHQAAHCRPARRGSRAAGRPGRPRNAPARAAARSPPWPRGWRTRR